MRTPATVAVHPFVVALLLAGGSGPLGGCVHATGQMPSGPPPEYEETPLPTSASTQVPREATTSLPTAASARDLGAPPTDPATRAASQPPALH